MANQIQPTVGRIVLVRGPSLASNGVSEHPAIINRVWTRECINVTVFPDCGPPTVLTSVVYGEDVDGASVSYAAWRWPDRA